MKPFGGIRTRVLLNIWVGGWISWVCDIHQLQPYLKVIPFSAIGQASSPFFLVSPHSLGGGGLLFLEAETHPEWTIFQQSLQRTPLTEQLALGRSVCVEGGHIISCFHFQFFRKTGLPLVFGKCFQSNNQLWRRRSSPLIFNEPKLMRCHNDSDFLKLLNELSLVLQPLSWKIVMNVVGCR